MDLTRPPREHDCVRVYTAGRCGGGQPLTALGNIEVADGAFIWVMLGEGDTEELALAARRLGFAPRNDRPSTAAVFRASGPGKEIVATIRVPEQQGERLGVYSVTVHVGRRYVVTVAAIRPDGWHAFRTRLESDPRQLRHGPDYLLHALLDDALDQCLALAARLEEKAASFEARAATEALDRSQLREIMVLQHDLTTLGRAIDQNRTIAEALVGERLTVIDADVLPYFRDVLDHARRAWQLVRGAQAVVQGLGDLSAAPAADAERTIRRLTAWALILAMLTAFTALFSMYFPGIPGLKSRFGYVTFVLVVGGLCAAILYRFRRARWV